MKLEDRVEDGLNELRILLLGGQVFAAFAYQSCFQARFDLLPEKSQWVQAIGITIITAAFGWLIFPAAYHQIAESGVLTRGLQRVITRTLDWGLFPMAIALALLTHPVAVAARFTYVWWPTAFVAVAALAAWYSGALIRYTPHVADQEDAEDLEKRIKIVLTECRVVLPGAQASLGFLFADVFTESFAKLPRSSQYTHCVALVLILIATVLLMVPAAYHRLATRGEPEESVHTVASRALLASLVLLAPGMGGELFVVLRKLTGHTAASIAVAASFVALCYLLWFVFSVVARSFRNSDSKKESSTRHAGRSSPQPSS